jgi:two-component system, sensor histidine kinase and response regulator
MRTQKTVSILMVDDQPSNLMALEATLESLGQNFVKAASGEEALRHVLQGDFAVILLDVQMPGLSGIETAALIREREQSRQIPIIFLTGSIRTEEMRFKGYSAGAVDYLMKPIEPEILRAKVEVFVELAIARQELQEQIAERERIAAEVIQLNTALEQKNRDLTTANADLEAFAHTVSHDLRAPLRHIDGYLNLLEASAVDKLTPEERRHMNIIREAAQRMAQLIDDLLTFSRIGRAQVSKRKLRMNALVEEALDTLRPDLADRHIIWDIQPLPEIRGDANLLRQVWTNLMANAVKYTRPRDPAKIEIGSAVQDDHVVFHVRDNGVGFKMEYAQKLFGVFQRLHGEKEFEGTGIGLANVRRIIEKHGGRTWAEAREGEGAMFRFSLPAG